MYQKYTKGWQGKFLLCFATIAIIGLFLTLFEGLDYFMAFLLTGFFGIPIAIIVSSVWQFAENLFTQEKNKPTKSYIIILLLAAIVLYFFIALLNSFGG